MTEAERAGRAMRPGVLRVHPSAALLALALFALLPGVPGCQSPEEGSGGAVADGQRQGDAAVVPAEAGESADASAVSEDGSFLVVEPAEPAMGDESRSEAETGTPEPSGVSGSGSAREEKAAEGSTEGAIARTQDPAEDLPHATAEAASSREGAPGPVDDDGALVDATGARARDRLLELTSDSSREIEVDARLRAMLDETSRVADASPRVMGKASRPPAGTAPDLSRAEELVAALAATVEEPARVDPVRAAAEPAPAPAAPAEKPVLRSPAESSDARPPAADGATEATEATKEEVMVSRPPGAFVFKTMWHKTAAEFVDFAKQYYTDWVSKGHVARVQGKGKTVIIIGEKPNDPADPLIQTIADTVDYFDDLELKLESRIIRPRYAPLDVVMDALVMRGLANVWHLVEETDSLTWKEGNKNRTVARKRPGYIQAGMVAGATAPLAVPPKIPYVYEMPSHDTFQLPVIDSTKPTDRLLMTFDNTSSTEERNGMVVVGTMEDIEAIQAFVDTLDVPARRIMIEVQLVELEANALTDIGIDAAQFGGGHSIGNLALPLPGEPITQPGFGDDVRRDPEMFVPDIAAEGFQFIFDDTSIDLSGRFLANIHLLVREGEAKIRARPKLLTLDDRPSVIHLGRNLPTFESTAVTRDSVDGNLISEVQGVGTIYTGFTLHLRPRVTGGAEDEVLLQVELVSNEVVDRVRVFEQDLAGVPETISRRYIGENRVKNHRPIILGGLIQEVESESINKIPLLADIPLLGYLFRRTQTSSTRREIILVLTPHILSEKGWDPAGAPKESIHFDTHDSVLFNDRHIIKGSDVLGLDPISNAPAQGPDGRLFTEEQIVDLTLLNIVKKRELVSKLSILEDYLGDEIHELSWIQRKWPESTVAGWDEEEKELYFRAAAICIDNIKDLNPDFGYEELVLPRREIVLPTSPYRITLSYNRVRALQSLATQVGALRGERVELDEGLIELLKESSGRSFRAFADFLERRERAAEDHGDVLPEIKRLYSALNPGSNALEGLSYPEVYRELERAKLNFVSLATYFQTNLDDRYALSGAPNVGAFGVDLRDFLETSVSLVQRARELKELEAKWRAANSTAEDE